MKGKLAPERGLFVVRKQPGQILKQWSEVGVPVLAIEFLSPSTAARDRGAKRRIYQGAGVKDDCSWSWLWSAQLGPKIKYRGHIEVRRFIE